MGRIEELCEVYSRSISAPWMRTSSGSERVLMVVYDKELERSLRNRVNLFQEATSSANHPAKADRRYHLVLGVDGSSEVC
jgi:hypothetical protein